MKLTLAIFLSLMAGALLFINTFSAQKPEQPKPSPYVIFFHVCGRLEGIIIVADPPEHIGPQHEASARQLEVMYESHAQSRVRHLQVVRRKCSIWLPRKT